MDPGRRLRAHGRRARGDPRAHGAARELGGWRHPLLEGPLSAVDVRRGIEGVGSPVLRCYQALIAQYPGGIGAVEVRFVVTSEGAPTELSVAGGPVAAPWSQGCVEDALGGARFVSSSGATTVSWTLTLDEQASRLRYVGGYFPS